MDSNRKTIAGGTILALASLLIAVVFLLPNKTEAFYLTNDGQLTISQAEMGGDLPGADSSIFFYKNTYPSTGGGTYGGTSSGGGYTGSRLDLLASACSTTVTNDTVVCDLETLKGVPYGNGTYWLTYYTPSGSPATVINFYNFTRTSATNWTSEEADPFNVETRLTNASATGTATTTLFNVDYFIKLDEVNNINRPDTIAVTVTNSESTQINLVKKLILPITQGNGSTTITMNGDVSNVPLSDGTYSAWFNFYNFSKENFTFTNSQIVVNFTIVSGTVTSSTIVEQSDGLIGTIENPYVEVACGITSIGGCIQNAFTFMFYPSESAITSFTDLYDTLSTKFPFAYFTDFNDSIGSVFDGTTTADIAITVPFSTFGDIDLISADQINAVPFTSTIRTLLGALIWIMLGLTVYRRTQKIFNQEHTT